MRVFVIHNRYGSEAPSGENIAVDQEIAMLRQAGVEVGSFITSSDSWRRAGVLGHFGAAVSTIWNPVMIARAARAAAHFRPDVIHVHNSYPTFSNFLFGKLKQVAPVALTLHNFRLFCAAGTPLRASRPCLDCIDRKSVLPALRHGCYGNSRLRTIPLATSIALHRWHQTWSNQVDGYICFTDYHRRIFEKAGLPAQRLFVKPNCYPGEARALLYDNRYQSAVYVGRLSEEKGIEQLVKSWLEARPDGMELRIIGDGPLRAKLEALCKEKTTAQITFLGQLPHEAAVTELGTAAMALVPSITIEGFPMVLTEAVATGTPSLVSSVGPLPSIIASGGFGEIIDFGNAPELAGALNRLKNRKSWQLFHQAALDYFNDEISSFSNASNLIKIYSRIIGRPAAE